MIFLLYQALYQRPTEFLGIRDGAEATAFASYQYGSSVLLILLLPLGLFSGFPPPQPLQIPITPGQRTRVNSHHIEFSIESMLLRASSYEPGQPGWLGFRDLASVTGLIWRGPYSPRNPVVVSILFLGGGGRGKNTAKCRQKSRSEPGKSPARDYMYG